MIEASLIHFPEGYIFHCNGFDCLVKYGLMCSINGYVRLPAEHPGITNNSNLNYQVHGGITFTDNIRGYVGFWIDFDTAHYYDWIPLMDQYPHLKDLCGGNPILRDEAYVRNELFELTKQMAKEQGHIINEVFNCKEVVEGLLKQF